jgi:hypothetical protein
MSVKRGFLHHHESGARSVPHDSLGRYFGHEFITLMNPLSSFKPKGERDGVGEIARIGGG